MAEYTINKFTYGGNTYKLKDSVSGYLTSHQDISGKIDTAGTGLSKSGTTLNHSNSVTVQTTQAVYPIKIDACGHISAYGSAVTIGAAAAKGVTDNSSNADVTSSDTNLITGRTLYYQLAKKGYTTNTGTVTKVSTGAGLTGGDITGTGTIKAKLNSETSLGTIGTTDKLYAVGVDANGKLCVSVPWESGSSAVGYVSKTESTYATVGTNTSTVPIGISGYSSTDILNVDINGLDLIQGTDYTISGSNIVLTTPITTAGTIVHFVDLRMTTASVSDYDALKGDSGLTSTSVAISVANWNGTTTCTKTVSGVTSSNNVFVAPAPASMEDYNAAGIYCSAQGTNSLTFTCKTIPTVAVTVNVAIG